MKANVDFRSCLSDINIAMEFFLLKHSTLVVEF